MDAPDHIMTVDVEDWFHILEAEGAAGREEWPGLEARVEANTDALLQLLDETRTRATFFVVGWIAWRHPELVRRIAAAGHEIGSHSFWHEVVRRHDRRSLQADLIASRHLLEDIAGAPVLGFRAPGNSITPATAWCFDLLVEAGYRYDSSLCPGASSHGGFPSPYFGPHRVRCAAGTLDEIPSSTVGLAGRRIPYAGGGYLRLLPTQAIRACIRIDERAGRPVNVYVHPREIDPGQPRMQLPWKRRFKYYVGLSTTRGKLATLLRQWRFGAAADWLAAHRTELAAQVLDVRAIAGEANPDPDPRWLPPVPPVGLPAA